MRKAVAVQRMKPLASQVDCVSYKLEAVLLKEVSGGGGKVGLDVVASYGQDVTGKLVPGTILSCLGSTATFTFQSTIGA
ncbi:hypothetical protein BTVI_37115 [Pitangus sulphuratus]|nr:hypothetical protein BTVI_37115 [Pitangus sulphuratus]